MHRSNLRLVLSAFLLLIPFQTAPGQHHAHQHGEVDFAISCNAEAQSRFNTGIALLHHMMYEQAETAFQAAAEADPRCAMAHWGIAMTQLHPLWAPPTEAEVARGQAAAEKAKALAAPTRREQAYITAAGAFFEGEMDTGFPTRLAAWEAAQKKVFTAHPEDIDAGAFYALARLATAPKADKTFAQQREAGKLLEQLHAKAPEHPGLFHYIIHAYDNPVLAGEALQIARGYDKLAPDVPHALHMPSHIFVRLGLWPDVISWNTRSAAAAKRQPIGGKTSMHYPHAMDYLMYAHLQQGQDEKAKAVLAQLLAAGDYQDNLAAAYGLAAAQARYVLERAQWADAAALPVRTPAAFPWDRYPAAESILYFARGLGAARTGDAAAAREAIAQLDILHQQLVGASDTYWAIHTDAQRKSVAAWLALSEGRQQEALQLARAAADLEDSVDKHPVTPSAVLPARELLGDMLLLAGKPAEAAAAYEAALAVSPKRFNSMAGSARAAELAGRTDAAGKYYAELVELASQADVERPAVAQARTFLAKR